MSLELGFFLLQLINKKNAFNIKFIDGVAEIVRRSTTSQHGSAHAQAEELKHHSNLLETCANIYSHRVDSTLQLTRDICDDLDRIEAGMRIRQDNVEEKDGDADVAEEGKPSKEKKDRQTALKPKKPRKPRRSHLVEQARELACSETEVNANVSTSPVFFTNFSPVLLRNQNVFFNFLKHFDCLTLEHTFQDFVGFSNSLFCLNTLT